MNGWETFESLTDGIVIIDVLTVLGVIYASWLATYPTSKAAPVGSSLWFRLPTWAQIAIGVVVTVLGAYLGYLLWVPFLYIASSGVSLILRVAGLALLSGGTFFVLWGRWSLGAMMGVSTSTAVQLQARHQLIRRGAYAFVRHPMYLGYWLLLAGMVAIYRTWSPLIFLVMLIASLYRRARREEQALEAAFGDEWRQYAARAPMFIPRWK